jgi:FG-GAP-like repeat
MLRSRAWLVPAVLGVAVGLAADANAGPALDVEARNVSGSVGIADFSHTYGATVADWNDDGWEDVLLNKHYDSFPRLMVNEGGRFADLTDDAFPMHPNRRDYHGCAVADVDLNDELDLYCTVGGKHGGNGANRKELWLQDGGEFTEHAQEWGVRDEFGRGRQATFIDANGDEFPDLYVTNLQPRKDGLPGPNRLFLNVGGEEFRNAPEFGVNRRIGGGVAQAVDFDLDGWQDLFLCSQNGIRIFRNVMGQRFQPVTRSARANGFCGHAALAPVNLDARPDLVVLHQGHLRVFLQGSKRRLQRKPVFRERIKRALTFALGDMNGDEIPDVYVVRSSPFDPQRPRDGQSDARDVMLASKKKTPSFTRVSVPSSRRGIGESVAAIDHDENGLSDFIVANGRFKAIGPTRLTAFYPEDP